ncbi:hypothetical protein ACMHYB_02010 [Sorangium sp. So ce1128]
MELRSSDLPGPAQAAPANAGSYTYLQIERPEGTLSWVVTLASSQGARSRALNVQVVARAYADRFVSRRLNRSFDGLYFAVVRPA